MHITAILGPPNIDIFANRCNRKCERFVSRLPDPDAFAVDAFTLCWNSLFFYASLSFILIPQVLKKVISDGAEGIVVVPL